MNLLLIIFIAIGLAMDASAVSISIGISACKASKIVFFDAVKSSFFFGLFQSIMPLFGWLIGSKLKNFITGFDHWVVFSLLAITGIKMIYEANKKTNKEERKNFYNLQMLLILAIATSIDAFAVGISFAFLKFNILTPILVIGIVTFLMTLCCFFIGKLISKLLSKKMEILGGLILIIIGFKILLEHL